MSDKPPPVDGNDASASEPAAAPIAASDSYKIGYGKPPSQHQFKKGDGRKRGRRPKGGKNVKTLLRKAHARLVRIRNKDGSVSFVSAIDGLIQKDVAEGFEKDRVRGRQIELAMQMDDEDEAKDSAKRATDVSREDAAILARYLPAALAPEPVSEPAPAPPPPTPDKGDQS